MRQKLKDILRYICSGYLGYLQVFFSSYYNDITWVTWCLKSPTSSLFVQQLVQANNQEITAPVYWPFVRGTTDHQYDHDVRSSRPLLQCDFFFNVSLYLLQPTHHVWITPRSWLGGPGTLHGSVSTARRVMCAPTQGTQMPCYSVMPVTKVITCNVTTRQYGRNLQVGTGGSHAGLTHSLWPSFAKWCEGFHSTLFLIMNHSLFYA